LCVDQNENIQETTRYSKVFWERCKELPDYEKIHALISKGEVKLEGHTTKVLALVDKIENSPNPWFELEMKFYSSIVASCWLREADVYLLCLTYKYGFGQWEKIREALITAWQFEGDFFVRSRNVVDIERRVNSLLRVLEKEFLEKQKEMTASQKNKKKHPEKPNRYPFFGDNSDLPEEEIPESFNVGKEIVDLEMDQDNENGEQKEINHDMIVEDKKEKNADVQMVVQEVK